MPRNLGGRLPGPRLPRGAALFVHVLPTIPAIARQRVRPRRWSVVSLVGVDKTRLATPRQYAWLVVASRRSLWHLAIGSYNSGVIYFIGRLWCAMAHREMHHDYGSKRRLCVRCLQVALA